MTERWWAPTRATLEMDAVVKAIFDTPGDVATAMLGAHRAGAAAVETVAKGAVPSEVGLVRAMAAARTRFAPAMVESLATAVGNGSYAGLLARDVLDAAEVGALDLFRTCVAKGISPPLAAQRAGAIYGVPMRELGLYTSLAVTPGANPLALADAADRAMLTYFDKISKTETFESVSKATPNKPVTFREPDRPVTWDPTEHPRDETGEFVRVGDMTFAVAPEQEQAAPVETPPRRRARGVRRVRGVRRAAEESPTLRGQQSPTLQGQQSPTLRHQSRSRLANPRRSTAELDRLNAGKNKPLEPRKPPDAPTLHLPSDLMEQLPVHPRDWTVLQQDLVITVDDIVGRAVDKKMPGGNSMSDPKVMRIGHLVNLAGAPEIIGTKAAQTTGEGWANYIKKWYPGYVEPTVQINETGSELERSIIISRMTGGDRVEEFNVRVSNDYETGDEILVHLQPDTTNPNGNRSRPTLDEYVISEGAMGEVNGRIHPQVELDPNQTYRRSQKPTQFFDRKRNVFINRWQLHLVDEDSAEEAHKEWRERGGSVGKAVRYADDEDHWRVQPRDESGRWRDEVAALIDSSIKAHEGLAVDEPTPTKPAPRKSRGTRKVRGVRRAEDATPTLKAKPQAELKSQRGAQLQTQRGVRLGEREMSALKAGLAKPPKNPLLPPLDDRERYQVFTMSKFLRRLDDDTAMDAKTPIRLTGHEHERFAAVGSWFTGEGVANQIGTNVAQMVAEKEGEISETATSWRGQRRFMQEGTARTQAEWDALGQQIQQIQRENPDIALISIEYIGDGSAYRLYANREPVEDQVLLEYEDELDFNQPIELIPLGTFQSIDMTMKRPDLPGAPITSLNMLEEQPVNAKIHYMRASNARVHRYRAQNREHETGR